MIWENKKYQVKDVIEIIKNIMKEAKFNKDIIKEVKYIIKFVNSREDLIKFLPRVNGAEKISYNNIRNMVKKIEPTNFINIVDIILKVPVYMKPYNILIVNNSLYHYSPYGVMKYQYRKKTTKDNNMINAILEATNLNKINKYNTIEAPIFNFRGKLLQNIKNEIFNLETNKKYDLVKALTESNYWEREKNIDTTKLNGNIDTTKLNGNIDTTKLIEKLSNIKKKVNTNNLIYILNKGPKSYLIYSNKVVKEDEFSSKINKVIKENNLRIFGVISKYKFNKNLKYSTLFLCNDNLYFSVTKNVVSVVKDFKKDYGFSISKKIPNYMSCMNQKIIFNQMIKENILDKSSSDHMLKKLKCKI